MDKLIINKKLENDKLIIENLSKLSGGNCDHWVLTPLTNRTFLLEGSETSQNKPKEDYSGYGILPVRNFLDYLLALAVQNWTGSIEVEAEYGSKVLYFYSGKLVFASSNIIDDRLGEVAYREGMISLEELTISAAQVTREKKFGQVLVGSRVISNFGLWNALKAQVKNILHSVFQADNVHFFARKNMKSDTKLYFKEDTVDLLKSSFVYACMLFFFRKRLSEKATIRLGERFNALEGYERGNFYGDLKALCEEGISLNKFVAQTKLNKPNAIAGLFELYCNEICEVEGVSETKEYEKDIFFSHINSAIEVFNKVLVATRAAFKEERKTFPMEDLKTLVESFRNTYTGLFLDSSGSIHSESLQSIYIQTKMFEECLPFYESRIRALVHFNLQVSGDFLRDESALHIRSLTL